jgi:hypothetical protein
VTLTKRIRFNRALLAPGAGILLATVVSLSSVRAHDPPLPIKIAVFAFELEDLSPAAGLPGRTANTAATMEKVSSAARQELGQSGRYVVIDGSHFAAKPVTERSLRNCDGCEAGIAVELGAQQSLIGVVRKVTQTDYYVVVRIRDAQTGKIVDQQEANFAGDEQGWPSGVRMLIRHQVLPGHG